MINDLDCIYSYPAFFSIFVRNTTFCAGYANGKNILVEHSIDIPTLDLALTNKFQELALVTEIVVVGCTLKRLTKMAKNDGT